MNARDKYRYKGKEKEPATTDKILNEATQSLITIRIEFLTTKQNTKEKQNEISCLKLRIDNKTHRIKLLSYKPTGTLKKELITYENGFQNL